MPRQPRENEPGDTHHVFTRGVERSAVVVDEHDYDRATRLLAAAVERFDLQCHSWCFMSNHIHLLVTVPRGNLSDAMRWYWSQWLSRSITATSAWGISSRAASAHARSTASGTSSRSCATSR